MAFDELFIFGGSLDGEIPHQLFSQKADTGKRPRIIRHFSRFKLSDLKSSEKICPPVALFPSLGFVVDFPPLSPSAMLVDMHYYVYLKVNLKVAYRLR